MKTNRLLPLSIIALLFFCFLPSCGVVRISGTNTTYAEFKKQDKDTTISYELPVISPVSQTTQAQTKGDVTITVEIVPFTVTRLQNQTRTITHSLNSNFDLYEVADIPSYTVAPNDVEFTVRVRNNSVKMLRLKDIGVALGIDGNSISFSSDDMTSWNNGAILSGFEHSYIFHGPQLAGLHDPKAVYLTIQDVPISYNQASGVAKTDKFDWFFECKSTTVSKTEKVTYTYDQEPVYKEHCQTCNGIGYFEKTVPCDVCNGTGSYKSAIDGKYYTCYQCKGNKSVIKRTNCQTCGGKGQIAFPKSTPPPIAKQELWTGWQVKVVTIPQGATVKTFRPKSGEFETAGTSNGLYNWWCPEGHQYPFIIEYNGKSVKVLPYTEAGKPSPTIRIDFLHGAEPIVKVGKKVE